MACKTSFELYHNFPKVADESGFTFNTHRPRVHIEWNKIRLVDIESIIRERKFVVVEQHVNDILDCVLESEFDVRILDEGVLKIFRLAQLAVEYQQFCRHYLDRSVYVLREEVNSLAQEIDSTKRLLREKEEEIRKLRKRSKQPFRTPLPYGNENIATMILKTLNNKGDIFPTLTSTNTLQRNKCTYCDKVFLNQLYLESHMARRHENVTDVPQKDTDNGHFERNRHETDKLNSEITELRSKLADMEQLIVKFGNKNQSEIKIPEVENRPNEQLPISKEMKDIEVSTDGEGNILDKIEQWKKEEHDIYKNEINLLRTQIVAMLDSFKEKEKVNPAHNDANIITELHNTIKHQGAEIGALKQELLNSRVQCNAEEVAKRKEIEAKMSYWVKHAELQSNEYKLLLQKLEEVAKEAKESRAQAEAERVRVRQLQNLLQENTVKVENVVDMQSNKAIKNSELTETALVNSNSKPNLKLDRMSLQKLQQKAQELLNIENTSTSDTSVTIDEKKVTKDYKKTIQMKVKCDNVKKSSPKVQEHRHKQNMKKSDISGTNDYKNTKLKSKKLRLKENLRFTQSKKENSTILPGSPVKIIRSKITEEVNSRLVALGVDPLKSRLPKNLFNRKRMQFQEQQQLKFKKRPGTEQILHCLIASIEENASNSKNLTRREHIEHCSPSRKTKAFSLSSVISNVKRKGLSLVKINDTSKNSRKSYDSVAKKAMELLRTPPSSSHSSPKNEEVQGNMDLKSKESQSTKDADNNTKTKKSSLAKSTPENENFDETDTESSINNNYENRKSPDTTVPNFTINTQINEFFAPTLSKATEEVNMNLNNKDNENSSDDVESMVDPKPRRAFSEDNILKQTKGVLKNATSTSSLNKKKVIFDMDAIQMKSLSASSPSQSITEKSENNENFGIGLVNLDNEEWDISSIENAPVQKNAVLARTSPKIAELKQTIESQMSRRNNTMSNILVGGVDVFPGHSLNKIVSSKGGSNTSLGSSILDDTESAPAENQVAFVKQSSFVEKDDSEIDISEFVSDEVITKNMIKSK